MLGFLGAAAGLAAPQPSTLCGTDGPFVARIIVQRELGAVPDNVALLAANDVLCDSRLDPHHTTHMANVVVATIIAEERLYRIFHIHFATDGTVHSLAPLKPWGQVHGDEWREAWCHFIRMVYAADAEAQAASHHPSSDHGSRGLSQLADRPPMPSMVARRSRLLSSLRA
ncbi:MAG: hypothetical protein ACREKS_13260 [Candidatus Rokuibacteriota bacterium]